MLGHFWAHLGIRVLNQNALDLMFINMRGRGSGNVRWMLRGGVRFNVHRICMRKTFILRTLLSLSQQIRHYQIADLKFSLKNKIGYMFQINCFDMEKIILKWRK